MEENKGPKVCNHCKGTDIIFHVWGRLEYYSCRDCKQEVKDPIYDSANPWGVWDPKMYGIGSDFTIPLPQGLTVDLDAFHGNESSDDGDWL